MSFSKTISVFAALASIFSVGLASWKISEEIKKEQTDPLEGRIIQLENELKEAQEKKPEPQIQIQTPPTPQLPPEPVLTQTKPQETPKPPELPPPPPENGNFE